MSRRLPGGVKVLTRQINFPVLQSLKSLINEFGYAEAVV